jgi:sialate O-acetylesterase
MPMMQHGLAWPLLLLGASAAAAQSPRLQFDSVFGDHMVLQQGKVVPVRGQAAPGAQVTVSFSGATATARADGEGRWTVPLAVQRSGSVGTLTVTSNGERVQRQDVAVGEVWLCSGQSNMDLTIKQTANPERTAREAVGQPIRIMKVQRTASVSPAARLATDIAWTPASEAAVADFSAACWHMALGLRARGITAPIGLIHSAWGGSTIEDWMSPDSLRAAGVDGQQLATLRAYAANPDATVARAIEQTDAWAIASDPGSAPAQAWSAEQLGGAGWADIRLPGQWERSGIKALASFDGVMWFRRRFELTSAQAAAPATLNLGRVDERDRVWINGKPIGATVGAQIERRYRVPAGLLKAGANVIAIRVIDEIGAGGVSSAAAALRIDTGDAGSVPLAGTWQYRSGVSDESWKVPPPFLPWAAPRGLAMAWHGMIAPLKDFPLAGVAWYQGESNTSRAKDYRRLLEQWRAGWRRQFGDPQLSVVIVQLPGFGPKTERPSDNNWAQLREVQRLVAEGDAKTGLPVAIDLGVSTDIHPAHKDVIGQRMAGEAMRVAYGMAGPRSPSPLSAKREAAGVRISFASAPSGLKVYGSAAPTSFEWCTAAKVCQFAEARVDGTTVLVTAPAAAAFIRYAWQGFPPVNLFEPSGLPVVPFEIAVR